MTKKRKIGFLIVQLVILIVAIFATMYWISTQKKEIIIYDYARTIQFNERSNYQLKESDIVEKGLMAADVTPEYVINKADIIGKYITGDVFQGTHVIGKQLSSEPPYIDKGNKMPEAELRKIYIPTNYTEAFAGNIKAGDVVDLLFLDESGGMTTEETEQISSQELGKAPIRYASAQIFMQDISVFQVYTADGSIYRRKETNPNRDPLTMGVHNGELAEAGVAQQDPNQQQQPGTPPAYVALAVTSPQFEEIVSRMRMGRIMLVGRFDGSEDQETNGYVVAKGDMANIYAGQGNLEKDIELFDDTQVVDPIEQSLPKLYTFIRNLSKVQMTDEQRERYASVYTKYSDYMSRAFGNDWESSDPDSITMEMLSTLVITDESTLDIFDQFKTELETLAKELRGNQVVLPW